MYSTYLIVLFAYTCAKNTIIFAWLSWNGTKSILSCVAFLTHNFLLGMDELLIKLTLIAVTVAITNTKIGSHCCVTAFVKYGLS